MNHVQSAETLPGNVPAVLTAASGVSSAFLSTLVPEASRLGVSAGPVPRDEGGAGSRTRCTWPIRKLLNPCSPDTGHVSVSELSPCKGSVDVETVWYRDRLSGDTFQRSWWHEGGCELAECWDHLGRFVLLGLSNYRLWMDRNVYFQTMILCTIFRIPPVILH